MKRRLTNLALVCGSVLIAILAFLAFDRILGAVLPDIQLSAGLIFAPGAEATYESHEFTYTATINDLGFRDVDVPLESERALRIVTFGDSFTFGMGVALEETWVKVLEENLRAQGYDLEILNLGCPGSNPYEYVKFAKSAIPALKPDVVLVGLLQMDDIRQSWGVANRLSAEGGTIRPEPMLRKWFPSISALVLRERNQLAKSRQGRFRLLVDIRNRWKRLNREQLADMTDAQKVRFRKVDPDIRKAFREGKINSIVLKFVLNTEGTSPETDLDMDSDVLQEKIHATSEALAEIEAIADAHGATVIGLSIPGSPYTSPSTWAYREAVGFPPLDLNFVTNVPDEAACLACEQAGFECVVVTEDFRIRAQEESLFYPVDTHFNARGNRVYADLLTPILEKKLAEL